MAATATTALTTLTVKKGASTASVSLIRTRDGAVYFVDTAGVKQQVEGNDWAKKLFDEINALV